MSYLVRIARTLTSLRGIGRIFVPLATVFLAFLAGGVVVFATLHGGIGTRFHNTLVAYNQIFDGTGLNWLGHFFRHPCLGFIPCHLASTDITTGSPGYEPAAANLSQTLLQTSPLILTGLAVAFAFRCGMFNIGGQGQFFAGLIVANWVGASFAGMSTLPHVLLAIAAATLAGAAWAGIAGVLKATVGAHEVISTIMLNWIAYWVAQWLVGTGGPLLSTIDPWNYNSQEVADSARIPTFWGTPPFQALDYGIFIALGALVVFWVMLNRTTLGYEVRAVGFNPDAAAYGGINVKKNFIRAMAISGAFAGLAGAVAILGGGSLPYFSQSSIPFNQVGFLGIAVALLGRNTSVGVLFSALLFAGLLFGTTHGLGGVANPVVPAQLAQNLTWLVEGFVVLFVSAPIVIVYFWNVRKKLRRPPARRAPSATAPEAAA